MVTSSVTNRTRFQKKHIPHVHQPQKALLKRQNLPLTKELELLTKKIVKSSTVLDYHSIQNSNRLAAVVMESFVKFADLQISQPIQTRQKNYKVSVVITVHEALAHRTIIRSMWMVCSNMFVYPKALQFSEAYGDSKKDSKFLEPFFVSLSFCRLLSFLPQSEYFLHLS